MHKYYICRYRKIKYNNAETKFGYYYLVYYFVVSHLKIRMRLLE